MISRIICSKVDSVKNSCSMTTNASYNTLQTKTLGSNYRKKTTYIHWNFWGDSMPSH